VEEYPLVAGRPGAGGAPLWSPPAAELTSENVKLAPLPARRRRHAYGDFMTPLSDDHNSYTSTMRDEFYIYNRPLNVEEIQEHIQQVKAKAATQPRE